jgi:hypothetical protein
MTNSYPSVNFSTKTTFRTTRTLPWRGTIGVVGDFGRGPVGPVRVNPETFRTLYGFDGSSGSAAVQQAAIMGATDFVISRAVPKSTAATSTIFFGSGNPLNVVPRIGYELQSSNDLNPIVDNTNYTTGLTLDLNFVGEPLIARTVYERVNTRASYINHPNFKDAQANLAVFVVDFKQGSATPTIRQSDQAHLLTATVADTTAGQNQVIEMSTTAVADTHDVDAEANNLLPGYVLTNGTVKLLILCSPYRLTDGKWGILVESLTDTTAGALSGLQIKDPDNDTYIMGYNLSTVSGLGINPYTPNKSYYIKSNEVYNDGYSDNVIHSYFSVDASKGGEWFEFYYDIAPSSSIDSATALDKEHFGAADTEGIYFAFGNVGTSAPIRAALKGQFIIPFTAATTTVGSENANSTLAYEVGTSVSSVLKDLRANIYAEPTLNSLINEVELDTSSYSYSLTLKTALEGSSANRVYYKLRRHTAGTESEAKDLYIRITGNDFAQTEYDTFYRFSNAYVGPRGGFRDYYSLDGTPILRLNTITPGVQDIRVWIEPDPLSSDDNPNVNITVVTTSFGNTTTETGQLRSDSIDAVNGVYQNTGLESITALFLPLVEPAGGRVDPSLYTLLPLRSAPPLGALSTAYNSGATAVSSAGTAAIAGLPLVGSFNSISPTLDNVETTKVSYLQAVKDLAGSDIAFMCIAGLPYGNAAYKEVFEAAFEQAKAASPESGLRQVFIEAPFNMAPRQSILLSDSIRNEFVSIINGHVTMALGDGTFASRVGLTGYYAGLISSRPPHIAPHSNYNGQYMREIVNSTSRSDPDSKNQYSRGRVESLHFDRSIGRWKFLNGLTTSTDPTKRYVSVVRLRLQLMSDLQNYLQWVLAEPNTRALQRKVETAVSAYMNSRLQEGWFLRLGSIVCNESNNSESDMVSGKLFVDISYVPVVPADFIFVTVNEDYTILESLQYNTRPVSSL